MIKKRNDRRDRGRTSGVDRGRCRQWFHKREYQVRENESRAPDANFAKREKEMKRNTKSTWGYI